MLVQLVLYKFSMWNSGVSYGAKLQGLRYIAPSRPDQRLTRMFFRHEPRLEIESRKQHPEFLAEYFSSMGL